MTSGGYDVHAFLRVSQASEDRIKDFFRCECGVRESALWHDLHLTVYEGRIRLPGLAEQTQKISIKANADETRFMLFRPGGINPQPDVNPRKYALGIRLTRRNDAFKDINVLRQEVIEYERKREIRGRSRSTLKRNAFGPREYVQHIKLLNRDNRISLELSAMGDLFRAKIGSIEFTHFEVHINAN